MQTVRVAQTPPEKRGGIREGAGRPKERYDGKKLRELLPNYKAAVKLGQIKHAHIAARKLPAAMIQAQVHVDKSQVDLDPAFLKGQANRGVCRKVAFRKLKRARLQLRTAALAARACQENWEQGVAYFRDVEKEYLGASAVNSTRLGVSVGIHCCCGLLMLFYTYEMLRCGGLMIC